MRLQNKKAIITGAAGGFGKEASLTFAKEGADVILADINIEGAKKVAEEIKKIGRRGFPIFLDVTDENNVKKTIHETIKEFGRIDILINNAGIARSAKIQDITFEEWSNSLKSPL